MMKFPIRFPHYQLHWLLLLPLATAWFVPSAFAQPKPVFQLHSGDRVVLVGDTLIEREQTYGYLEQRLTVRFPEANVTFRNLGWSADTPAGESRASFDFDKPGKGFELLKEEIGAVQPTVVIVGYGMASSFKGMAGVAGFKADYNKLLDAIESICTNKPVRFVLLSPIRHENLGPPLPDPTEHNLQLALYTKAIDEIATERKATFISLFDNLLGDGSKTHPPRAFTDDGIHLAAYGYLRLAEAVEKRFVWEPNIWRVEIAADGKVTPGSYGTKISNLDEAKDHVRFTAIDDQLVSPFLCDKSGRIPSADAPSLLQVDGLKSGTYELKVDGVIVATASAKEWKRGVAIEQGPQFEEAEQLRHAIIKKNQLYFDRWRPQNETYLFGFRKHEQGQNAKEIPMFDPLIKEQEANIARYRKPAPHTFELAAGKAAPKPSVPKPAAAADVPLPMPKSEQPLPEFEVAPGFEVSLYAESPLLAKPIQMNFDPRGRLWVVSSSVYPQIQPGQEADDKVLILEDTKGVGKVDKSTVFADGLLIPTGVEPGDGGVYVGQSTELLHFKDTKGTGKADQRRVVLSGFGTEDTHHIVHTLHWGPDGQLYFDQSIYIHSHIETPHGVERLNSGGVWHLRPPTMELGVFLRGFCNPWGHQFDEFGQSFVTDGAGGQGISFGIPGATYFTYAGMRRELKSVSPGNYPKFCALELIRSRQFPDDWQGNAITCDFRAHRVVRFAIDEKDSGYATREMPDLLRSTNVTFRPIDVKLGPDGALYIADWANPVIQHGEVDFRDPRRDHEHGRIWRVAAKGRPLLKKPNLIAASNHELLDELISPNLYNQQQARRVLTERGKAIQSDLAKWANSRTEEKALLEALWMYQAIDVVEPALLDKLLNAHDGHIRAAATRVVSYWHPRLREPMALLSLRIADDFPRVRIEAMRALAEIPTARSAELVLSALSKPMDPFLDYAAWLSINDLARPWVAAVQSGQWKADSREAQLEFGLKAIEPSLAAVVLGQVLQNKTIPADGSGPWIELIGQAGGEKEVRRLFDQLVADGFSTDARLRVLTALTDAQRLRSIRPSGELTAVGSLFKGSSARSRQAALKLAGAWKLPSLVPQILAIAGNPDTPVATRKVAFESLREIGGKEVTTALEPLTGRTNEIHVRHEAVLALTGLDLEQAKQPILDSLADLKVENDALEFWRALLGVKGVAPMLAKALPKAGLSPIMAKAGLRVAREAGREQPELIVALTRGADLESEGLGLTDAEMKQIAVKAARDGDPARGELIFRRREIGCVLCHAIGGVGGKVGPDMTSIGASAPMDYLIESVFYPNRKIKEGYHSTMIETKDGTEFAGILVREDQTQVVLRDTTDKEISIPVKDIQTRKLGNSLMPSGLVDTLTSAQQLDLFRFLSELGKPGPYDASKGNVARFWKLLPQNMDGAQFEDAKFVNGNTSDPAWQPAASLVDGRLLKSELQGVMQTRGGKTTKAVFAASHVQVSGKEPLQLQCNGVATKDPIWIDGKIATAGAIAGSLAPVQLSAGVHTVVVKLDTAALPDSIQLQCSGGTFLAN